MRLLGSALEGEEKLLIYEFMSNKSLDQIIFGLCCCLIFQIHKIYRFTQDDIRLTLVLYYQDGEIQNLIGRHTMALSME